MEQLTALDVEPRDQESVAMSLAALKSELAKEKAAWEKAKAETLARAVGDLKKTTDGFTTQIPILE
jgi:hypothetical protein